MKYTKENIPEGLTFQAGKFRYRVDNIIKDQCLLTCLDKGKKGGYDCSNYELSTVAAEINKGRWTVVEEIYQIY